ncbi:MAG: AAA family ATPase [Halopseudomonas sabulinigri]
MEHFPIILALSRAALQTPSTAVSNHLQRLIKALEKSDRPDQASAIEKLLRNPGKSAEIQPSRVVLSFAAMGGETLTPSVKAPVDRETSAPLAEIVFPADARAEPPVFAEELATSVSTLIEEWESIDKLRQVGVKPALSLMMFGAPGTGKTLLAHHLSRTLGYPLVIARLDGLVSSFLGTTARNISNLFSFANRYKCILLLDEFDAVAKLRDDPNELGELKRVVNTLLQCLDSRSEIGFTIAITNHENLLDPAVWRRFDARIEVPKPHWKARKRIIENNFEKFKPLTEVQLSFLTWLSDEYSGSEIEKLSDFIKRRMAIQDKDFDFLGAIKHHIQLSAKEIKNRNRSITIGKQEELAYALNTDPSIAIPQEKLAELFGKTQSTISRWLKRSYKE